MLSSFTHELVAEELLKEKYLRSQFGKAVDVNVLPHNNKAKNKIMNDRLALNNTLQGRDVFGNEKLSDSSTYFVCGNCNRNIAGGRFANHINRCLGGRNSKKD